ncbi:hypothetical protein GH714_036005 [Hevea brasiliensis]|uniref:Uncharacterized protein n=1 Tax=Hevea brasiliensis TaxID=3981 RepID=A0A6A6L8X5_HEVBR|nr:hypothetical protein GH714_036005 [Hevea brasiliensis]
MILHCLKYFDCTRSGPRSAFGSNVVYQFEIWNIFLTLDLISWEHMDHRYNETLFKSRNCSLWEFEITWEGFNFIDGEPVYKGCCRTNIGGYRVTGYLKQLLSLKYAHHTARFTREQVEDMKMEYCYIAPGYASEARLFQVVLSAYAPFRSLNFNSCNYVAERDQGG